MFGKKPQPEPSSQSQSLSGVSITGGMVQLGQAGGDVVQNQSGNLATQQQGLSGAEVLKLLESLEQSVQGSTLSADQQSELLDYLRPAKRESAKENPKKELVGQNLKQVSETLKALKDSTEAGKSLWQTGTEVLTKISPWLGVATKFFGL